MLLQNWVSFLLLIFSPHSLANSFSSIRRFQLHICPWNSTKFHLFNMKATSLLFHAALPSLTKDYWDLKHAGISSGVLLFCPVPVRQVKWFWRNHFKHGFWRTILFLSGNKWTQQKSFINHFAFVEKYFLTFIVARHTEKETCL